MAGDPRALLRQVGTYLANSATQQITDIVRDIGRAEFAEGFGWLQFLWWTTRQVYDSRDASSRTHELTHVTDEAAAEQFIAAANAFRMQKMGTKSWTESVFAR
jgi:hypothetical protein